MSESVCVRCFDGGDKPHSVPTPATKHIYDSQDNRVPLCQAHWGENLLATTPNSDYRDYLLAVLNGTPGPMGEPAPLLAERIQAFHQEAERRGVPLESLQLDRHHHFGPGLFVPAEGEEAPAPEPEPPPMLPADAVKMSRKPKNKAAAGAAK